MRIGLVGHAADKFTSETEQAARTLMATLVGPNDTVVSGHCHLGGIDIWAEELADAQGLEKLIFPPTKLCWEGGYKQRNIQIAQNADKIYCLVIAAYPPCYTGMRFSKCYHCGTSDHVKSGGCWTVKYGRKLGKVGSVLIV